MGVGGIRGRLRRLYAGPWILGRLARRARGFVYVSRTGFLSRLDDSRDYEFGFLKRRGLRIVCVFTGTDIRSPKLMKELETTLGRPNVSTYQGFADRATVSADFDEKTRRAARAADRHADLIYSMRNDQRSYLTRPTLPFLYFYPDDGVQDTSAKFSSPVRLRVLHAPSSPIIKGTQVVRAAVQALRDEGREFDYEELIDVPHERVVAALRDAHIVLNQFYAFVPGVFGVEALAAGCAVLQSADPSAEPDLPGWDEPAWFVTQAHEVTAHLRTLLDDPALAARYARLGQQWVRDHALASESGRVLREQLGRVLADNPHVTR
ncbi:glycosyltransferase [Agromyces sp. NPDC058064]|uniref:glycosyltransferase n=1 Tax=Agromyces sp. NPDC058064 TaxID=3346322 RepID=UPI0036DDFC4E